MSTYTQHLFQWVWSTKYREHTMDPEGQKALYAYIHKLLNNKKCHVYAVNGK